ncbi:MAG: Holliday junction resolvase RuvX [Clostridia bacterium]|nr:Holliday junction resolvase RuvX [Clostridia bacterium]
MTPRVLALDVGEKRIGVAVSDPLGLTAQGLETIQSSGWSRDAARIGELLAQYETDRLLVGLPRSMSGEIGPQAQKILAFAEQLTARGWQVRFQDERLTTSLAQRTLIEGGVGRGGRRQVVDKLAATYILQSFLDAGGWTEERQSGAARVLDVAVWKGMKKMETGDNNSMEMDNIIELVDENDNPIRFEHIMTVQYGGDDYILLAPVDPTEDMEEDEVLVLRIDNDENGEEIYVSVEDDGLVQKVFEKYLEIVESDEE